jgi:5'-methylthioadenosine phosphorylase
MADIAPVGLLGGTGFYKAAEEESELEVFDVVKVDTPFGEPSDTLTIGKLHGVDIVFLSRHGVGHKIPAHAVNYRANIFAMKAQGVKNLLSVSAVGSMRDEYHPRDLAVPAQLYDNTTGRRMTFFDGAPTVHVDLADPICPNLAGVVLESGKKTGATIHRGGTYLCMNGPAFSTRAESKIYRGWGVDMIGMSTATEAKLAREAEICYVSLCMITDYDVWKETEEDVTIEMIIENLRLAADTARAVVKQALPKIAATGEGCSCRNALKKAIVSDPSHVARVTRERLAPLLGKYLPAEEG